MSAFGQPPVFGAQAFSTDATSTKLSPFGAPSSHASSFPQSSQPAFGAPATFSSNSIQQSAGNLAFGSSTSATNAFGAASSSNGGVFGGQDSTISGATMSNPFAAATAASTAGAASNPFATQQNVKSSNPFAGAAPVSTAQIDSSTPNPFTSAGFASPFTAPSNPANGVPDVSQNTSAQLNSGLSPFGNTSLDSQKRGNTFDEKAESNESKWWGSNANPKSQQSQTLFAAVSKPRPLTGFGGNGTSNHSNGFEDHLRDKISNGFGASAMPSQAMVLEGQKKSPSNYAKEIHEQLRKDNLKPPPWPKDPGDPSNLKAMDDYRVRYKKYEGRVRTSLIKAGLIDDPDVRKKLSDAIDFRGICEDMCPEGEKVSRIVEHDVKQPERTQTFGKEQGWADPNLMVKSFKRSAAGTDSPLPTEVRSPAALRRTLDYLIDDLLRSEGNLRDLHSFLWDRTRAIRKDFIFQNAMTPEERTDQIYCLENITRFHAVSLHLLSKEGAASDGFSEQQEREQLGKTLLSLMQVYDECKDMEISIENEAEFRAYYLLFNAHDPFVIQQMQDWNDKFWFDSPEIQTVVTLIEAMQNVWNGRGPLRPAAPLTTGSASFTSYFAIVEDPNVSYSMACLAEIHFTEIRRRILKSIHKAYGRVRDGPKDLTAKVLNSMFRFDTEDECVAFLKELEMEFSSEGASEPYLVVERRRGIPGKTIKQSFSQAMVERKRGTHTLPEVIHNTVFEEVSSATTQAVGSPDSLFVTQSPDTSIGVSKPAIASMDVSFSDDESPSSTPVPAKRALSLAPTSLSNGLTISEEQSESAKQAVSKTTFFPPPSNTTAASNPFLTQIPVTAAPAMNKSPPILQSTANPFGASTTSNSIFNKPPAAAPAEEQLPKQMPAFSLGTNSNTAHSTSIPAASGGIFDFLDKAKDQPSLFASTPNVQASPGIFSREAVSATPNQGTEKAPSNDLSATKTMSETNFVKSGSDLAPFTSPASGATESVPTPTLFTSRPTTSAVLTAEVPTDDVPFAHSSTFNFTPSQNVATAAARSQGLFPPKDDMLDFAKWMLLGDDGLMEKLQETLVESLVRQAFDQYSAEERERRQKEEDERSWTQARKFRKYSLRVKFFYRWRNIARKRSIKRVGRQNREALRAYREAKAAEARASKIKKQTEEQARLKRVTGPTSWLDELDKERSLKRARRESMSLDTSRRSSPNSDAEALLATGVFSGMPNQHEAAEHCVRDDDSIYEALVGVHISPNSKRQIMGPPARPNKDPLRTVRDGGISKALPKQKLSKKAQFLADLMNGRHKEDDLISFKSSTSSRLGQSARASGSVTNFMKYQSSSPRSSVDPERPRNGPSSGIKTPYWLLRSRGLFATPTGHVLSDRAPRPRTDSFHDGVSQYSGNSEAEDYNDRVLEQDGAYRASLGFNTSRRSSFSVASAGSPPRPSIENLKPTSFRQSLPAGASSSMMLGGHKADGEAASQAGSAVSTLQQDVEETLRELRKVAAEMDEDTNWYREQNKHLSQGHNVSD